MEALKFDVPLAGLDALPRMAFAVPRLALYLPPE